MFSCMAYLCPLLCIKKGKSLVGKRRKGEDAVGLSLICMACCVGVCIRVCVHAWLAVYVLCVLEHMCLAQ